MREDTPEYGHQVNLNSEVSGYSMAGKSLVSIAQATLSKKAKIIMMNACTAVQLNEDGRPRSSKKSRKRKHKVIKLGHKNPLRCNSMTAMNNSVVSDGQPMII